MEADEKFPEVDGAVNPNPFLDQFNPPAHPESGQEEYVHKVKAASVLDLSKQSRDSYMSHEGVPQPQIMRPECGHETIPQLPTVESHGRDMREPKQHVFDREISDRSENRSLDETNNSFIHPQLYKMDESKDSGTLTSHYGTGEGNPIERDYPLQENASNQQQAGFTTEPSETSAVRDEPAHATGGGEIEPDTGGDEVGSKHSSSASERNEAVSSTSEESSSGKSRDHK